MPTPTLTLSQIQTIINNNHSAIKARWRQNYSSFATYKLIQLTFAYDIIHLIRTGVIT